MGIIQPKDDGGNIPECPVMSPVTGRPSDRWKRERDELLAMLKDWVDHPELDFAETMITPRRQFQAARALIARIEKP